MKTPELKPCPFCGGKAEIRRTDYGIRPSNYFYETYRVKCVKCFISKSMMSVFHMEWDQAVFEVNGYLGVIEAWNRRVNDDT